MENEGYSSPEISAALDKAGFTAPHTHVWAQFFDGYAKDNTKTMLIKKVDLFPGQIHYPAYRFEQVWAMLPDEIEDDFLDYGKCLAPSTENKGETRALFHNEEEGKTLYHGQHLSPVEAVCQLILWCISNGHIEVGG